MVRKKTFPFFSFKKNVTFPEQLGKFFTEEERAFHGIFTQLKRPSLFYCVLNFLHNEDNYKYMYCYK